MGVGQSVSSPRCAWWILRAGAGPPCSGASAGAAFPELPPVTSNAKRRLISALGRDALVSIRHQLMVVFFVFAMLVGAALQITNTFRGAFLDDFKTAYPGTFGVEYPNLPLSDLQISETRHPDDPAPLGATPVRCDSRQEAPGPLHVRPIAVPKAGQ
jgi:hypothetical protein